MESISDDASIFHKQTTMQPTSVKNLYVELDLISQFEKQCHEIRCLHAKSPDFQCKYKTEKGFLPWGMAPILDSFFSLMSHGFISGSREVKQQFASLRTKAGRIFNNNTLKVFSLLFFLFVMDFLRSNYCFK